MTDPYSAFRAAVESGDFAAAAGLFSADAVFRSPVVYRPYAGREALRAILVAVGQVFEDFRYVAHYADVADPDAGHVLHFATRVGDRTAEGVDILRGTATELTELTVLIRPYSALTDLRERMARLLT